MELLFLLFGIGVLGGLIVDQEDEAEEEANPDIDIVGTEAPYQGFAVVNDLVYESDSWRGSEISVDASSVEVGQDRIAIAIGSDVPLDDYSYIRGHLDFSVNENGDLEISSAATFGNHFILEGLSEAPKGLLEIHFVDQDLDGILTEDEIGASYENVAVLTGGVAGDHFRVEDDMLDLVAVLGQDGADTIVQTADVILDVDAGSGNDLVDTSDARDTTQGRMRVAHEHFVSTMFFSFEDDIVTYPYLVDTIATEAGDDEVILGARATQVNVGEGNDTITATTDAALYIYGDAGDDLIDVQATGADSDIVAIGGDGTDTFLGGAGNDFYFDNLGIKAEAADGVEYFDGGAGDDTIWGNKGSALIEGGSGDDYISGYDVSADYKYSAITPFSAWVDDAADTLSGGEGNDSLIGSTGDMLSGGSGEDWFGVNWKESATLEDQHAVITDFDPTAETLVIWTNEDDFDMSGDLTPSTEVVEGNMEISLQGKLLVVLEGVTTLPDGAFSLSLEDNETT